MKSGKHRKICMKNLYGSTLILKNWNYTKYSTNRNGYSYMHFKIKVMIAPLNLLKIIELYS